MPIAYTESDGKLPLFPSDPWYSFGLFCFFFFFGGGHNSAGAYGGISSSKASEQTPPEFTFQ